MASTTADGTWWKRATVTLDDPSAYPGRDPELHRGREGRRRQHRDQCEREREGHSGHRLGVHDEGSRRRPLAVLPDGNVSKDWAGSNNPVNGSGATVSSSGIENGGHRIDHRQRHHLRPGVIRCQGNCVEGLLLEIWFKTTTTTGGMLIGSGSAKTGSSATVDRHLYMTNSGTLTFGVFAAQTRATISGDKALNDGAWHHAVVSQSADGMKLYVDGELVASDPAVTNAKTDPAYVRIGGDLLTGWPSAPSSNYFKGSLDEPRCIRSR